MKDTPDFIYNKQFEIFNSKPLKERFLLNLELTEFVRAMTVKRILRIKPDLSENDLKIEVFRQTYSEYFTEKQKEIISKSLNELEARNDVLY